MTAIAPPANSTPATAPASLGPPAPSARSILFPAGGDTAVEPVRASLRRNAVYADVRRALDGLRAAGLDVVEQQIARQADEMLGATVVDLLLAGWRKHAELIAAARKTRDDPDCTLHVNLGHLPITVEHAWVIDVTYGALHTSIDFALTVVIDVEPVVAVVRHGCLVALGEGQATVHATFTAGRRTIAARSATVSLGANVDLEGGVPLITTATATRRPSPTPG